MRLVWGANIVPFVVARCGFVRDFGECQAAGVFDSEDRLAAGIVFHDWNPEGGTLEVSAAACNPAWAQRNVIREAFWYVFSNCQMAVTRTSSENRPVRKLWKAFGASEFVIPRLLGRHSDGVIYTLTDDEWNSSRFMRQNNGKA